VGDICPTRLLTVAKGTPRIINQEAKVCLRSWKWRSVKPAVTQAAAAVGVAEEVGGRSEMSAGEKIVRK
jgi:hypothetical protein